MIEYTGPVPPTPTAASTDAQWCTWLTYQTLLQNIRYENEREAARVLAAAAEERRIAENLALAKEREDARVLAAARALITDKQHADSIAADAACAAANVSLAEAQQAHAAALRHVADTPQTLLFPEVVRIALQGSIPVPDPTPPPVTTGLVAETIVLARKWAGLYAAPPASP